MIDLLETDSTLHECSLDSENKEYMTDSLVAVKNFDKVKDAYLRDKKLCDKEHIFSNDALRSQNNHWYFMEFKNGAIDNRLRAEIKAKMYDSLLIVLDLLNVTISDSRINMTYIFVYNEKLEHFKKDNKKGDSSMNSKFAMMGNLANKAKISSDLMKLSQYKGIYFKNVEVLNKVEFHHYIKRFT